MYNHTFPRYRMKYLCIDIGNTRTKAALFSPDGKPGPLWICENEALSQKLTNWLEDLEKDSELTVGWISTAKETVSEDWAVWKKFAPKPRIEAIRPTDEKLPIGMQYKTPETLGADRLIAAIAACSYFPDKPVMVVDAGTAITYDCVDAAGNYLGGGISPGVGMRFRALHEFTARLPLVEVSDTFPEIGASTEESIRLGAQGGAVAEVQGMIQRYETRLGKELKVFLTGGDAQIFEKHLKNPNFARFHLLLEGILSTLKYRQAQL
ncbi:MAG: type III pantothenate kinase [Bacteroidia bacterium]